MQIYTVLVKYAKICTKYARNMLEYAGNMQTYAKKKQVYIANNMQEIYKCIDCISQICKKYAMKICRNMKFYMQQMQKSIYCIFCIYMHSPLC